MCEYQALRLLFVGQKDNVPELTLTRTHKPSQQVMFYSFLSVHEGVSQHAMGQMGSEVYPRIQLWCVSQNAMGQAGGVSQHARGWYAYFWNASLC